MLTLSSFALIIRSGKGPYYFAAACDGLDATWCLGGDTQSRVHPPLDGRRVGGCNFVGRTCYFAAFMDVRTLGGSVNLSGWHGRTFVGVNLWGVLS